MDAKGTCSSCSKSASHTCQAGLLLQQRSFALHQHSDKLDQLAPRLGVLTARQHLLIDLDVLTDPGQILGDLSRGIWSTRHLQAMKPFGRYRLPELVASASSKTPWLLQSNTYL